MFDAQSHQFQIFCKTVLAGNIKQVYTQSAKITELEEKP